MSVESSPRKQKIIEIREEREPYSSTGKVFRLYDEESRPLYVGAETWEGIIQRIREDFPNDIVWSQPLTMEDLERIDEARLQAKREVLENAEWEDQETWEDYQA